MPPHARSPTAARTAQGIGSESGIPGTQPIRKATERRAVEWQPPKGGMNTHAASGFSAVLWFRALNDGPRLDFDEAGVRGRFGHVFGRDPGAMHRDHDIAEPVGLGHLGRLPN